MITRECPHCGSIIVYKSKVNRDNAIKKNGHCIHCCQTKKDHTKQCVICGNDYIGQGKTCNIECKIILIKQTKLQKYGDANYTNKTRYYDTCKKKYGVTNISQIPEVKQKKAIAVNYKLVRNYLS